MPDPTGVWILGYHDNEHDQPIDPAFLCVFPSKPPFHTLSITLARLQTLPSDCDLAAAGCNLPHYLDHILSGGGRLRFENRWFILKFVPFQETTLV